MNKLLQMPWYNKVEQLSSSQVSKLITKIAKDDYYHIAKYSNSIVDLYEMNDEDFNNQMLYIIDQLLDDEGILKTKTIYRVEHSTRGTGMWFDEYRNNNDYMNTSQPMPRDDKVFNYKGKVWYNATTDKNNFKEWFSKEFLKDLLNADYNILEIVVSGCQYYSNHVLYAKEDIISQRVLTFEEIYGKEK